MMHDDCYFITLTYSDQELPENGALHPGHLRQFIKDLRRFYKARSISYYGCGEYGEQTQRAHYHAVLFGAYVLDLLPDPDDRRDGVWISPFIESVWGRGRVQLAPLNRATASYVAGYVQKKLGDGKLRYDGSTGEVLQEPFSSMSLNPAIGRRYIEEYWRDVYPRDFVVVDGFELKPPRYYDKYMMLEDEKGGSEERRQIMLQVKEKRYEEMEDLDVYTLNAKETAHKRRNEYYDSRGAL